MNPSRGNPSHFDAGLYSLGRPANTKLVISARQRLPHYCVYCARDCGRFIQVAIEGEVSQLPSEIKAAGCLMMGFGLGRFLGLGLAMGPAQGMLEAGRNSQKKMGIPVCGKCQRERGIPRIERVEEGLQIRCCKDFATRLERGEFGGIGANDPY